MSLETQRQSDKVRIQQYQTLLEISEAIASNRDLTSLFHNLAQHLRAVVDFDWVSTLLYDPALDVMRLHLLEPALPDGLTGPAEMPVDDVPSGWVWKTQEPLIIRDAAQETRFPRIGEWARQNGVKSYCALPLTSAGRRLGALGFASVKDAVWSESDLEFLMQVARQVAVAIDNAINFESVRSAERRAARERDRIRLLLEINNAVVSHLELGALVKTISASLLGIPPHDAAGIALYEPEQNLLREYENVAYSRFDAFQKGTTIPLEGTPAGFVFTSGRPLLLRRPDPERFSTDQAQRPTEGSPKSACLAPLISHGRKLGIVGVASAQENRFTEEDLELLAQVADQVAIAVENSVNFERAREAERELARSLDHLRLMLRITNTVVSRLNLQELLDIISASIREVMGCDVVVVGLYDQESKQLIALSTQFPPGRAFREKGVEIPLEGSPGGLAFTSGQPVFLDKPDLERFNSDFAKQVYEDGYRSGATIPLIAQGRKLGVLGVASKRENFLSDDDKELLLQIANQVAIAVDNALNYERAREAERELARNLEHLRLMLRITNTVVSQLDLRELLDVISVSIREALGCDTVGVGLYNHENKQLIAFSTQLPPGHPFREKGVEIPLEGATGGLAFTTGQPVFLDKPDPERFNSYYAKRIYEDGYRSGGSIPLIAQGRKLGVLGVASKREDSLSADDKELLLQVANQVAIAVDNALNYERAREAERELARRIEQLRLMLKITTAVVSKLDLREILKVISSSIREVTQNDLVGVNLFDQESGQLRTIAFDLPSELIVNEEWLRIPLDSLPGLAFTSGQPDFVDKADKDRLISDYDRRGYELGYRSGGNIPLIAQGRKLGTLGFAS